LFQARRSTDKSISPGARRCDAQKHTSKLNIRKPQDRRPWQSVDLSACRRQLSYNPHGQTVLPFEQSNDQFARRNPRSGGNRPISVAFHSQLPAKGKRGWPMHCPRPSAVIVAHRKCQTKAIPQKTDIAPAAAQKRSRTRSRQNSCTIE